LKELHAARQIATFEKMMKISLVIYLKPNACCFFIKLGSRFDIFFVSSQIKDFRDGLGV